MIKRLRDLLNDYDNCRANEFDLADAFDSDVRAMLDRMEKLEVVAEAASLMAGDGITEDDMYTVEHRFVAAVKKALAALEDNSD